LNSFSKFLPVEVADQVFELGFVNLIVASECIHVQLD